VTRSYGVTTAVSNAVPDFLVPVLVVLTHFGDPAVVLAAAPIVYWFGAPRLLSSRDAARVLAVTVGALALVVVLKHWFAAARPPPAVARIVTDGYGFPSGHATGSAAFYGSLAAVAYPWTRRTRFTVAGVVVGGVAATRLLLGVHYLVDVLAGVLVGSAYAWVALRASRTDVRNALALAVVVGVAALAIAWTVDAGATTGIAAGALAAWTRTDGTWNPLSRRYVVVLAVLAAPAGLPVVLDAAPALALVGGTITGIGVVWVPARAQNVSRYFSISHSET